MSVIPVLIVYFFVVNLIGFSAMFIDKQRAKKRAFRIPESTLFTIAIIGGSIGCLFGMYLFRHKTRHWTFVYGMPFILFLQIGALLFLILSPIRIKLL
ncbi:MAG: DUF1294 domain-containing protein [Lachnospiraceae bacterium]|nr:DUF1294 domain-containing protein [Lachnospiraceae bacterium]